MMHVGNFMVCKPEAVHACACVGQKSAQGQITSNSTQSIASLAVGSCEVV